MLIHDLTINGDKSTFKCPVCGCHKQNVVINHLFEVTFECGYKFLGTKDFEVTVLSKCEAKNA